MDHPSIAQLDARVNDARMIVAFLTLFLVFYLLYSGWLRRTIRQKVQELAKAREDLDARGRAFRALLELGHALVGSRNTDTVTEFIVHQIQTGTGFDRVGIYLIDEDRGVIKGVTGVNEQGEIEDCSRYEYSLEDAASPIIRVAHGEVEHFLTDDAEAVMGAGRVKHNAFVPLRTADRVLGVIAVDNCLTGRPFGEKEVHDLRGFADEIALAFHNSRLVARAEEQQAALGRRNRELAALVEFGQATTTASTVEELTRAMWSTVRAGLGFDRVGIFLRDGDVFRGVVGTDERGQIEDASYATWPVNISSRRWQGLLSGESDYSYTPDYTNQFGVATPSGNPIKEHILVSIRTQEQVIGAIAVDNFVTGRPIVEEDAQPIVAFARQAATALQGVMLVEALRSSEEKMRLLIGSLTETLYSARVEGQSLVPLFYSPRLEELTGHSLDEALSTPDFWPHLVHSEDRDRYRVGLAETLQGASTPIEYRIVHASGEIRWVLDTPAPMRDEDGSVVRVNGALLDITERKGLEEGLRRAQKMETVGTLAGGIAHEFNNILGIIIGNLSLAQMDAGADNPAQYSISQARIGASRAAELTQQLLTFSAKIESRREPTCISGVVHATLELLQSSLGKAVKLETDLEPDQEPVSADPGQIQQVLINLCVNARDAMPSGGTIRIQSRQVDVTMDHPRRRGESPAGRYTMLTVTDTGPGMDASTRERIFEPFFTTKPVGRGTGLGLAVAYGIVGEHRGWMEVESEPGKGTTFRMYLPGVSAIAGSPARPETSPTALVVEASPSARSTLVDILEDLGYSTLTAATAAEALAIFWTDSDMVDLVISDSRPTGMDVEQLIGNIRDFKPDVPILIGAASHNGASRNGTGAAAIHIRKPYDAEEIGKIASAINAGE